jgi:hypothetical protein
MKLGPVGLPCCGVAPLFELVAALPDGVCAAFSSGCELALGFVCDRAAGVAWPDGLPLEPSAAAVDELPDFPAGGELDALLLLADGPDTPDEPDVPDELEPPDERDAADGPDAADAPDEADIPEEANEAAPAAAAGLAGAGITGVDTIESSATGHRSLRPDVLGAFVGFVLLAALERVALLALPALHGAAYGFGALRRVLPTLQLGVAQRANADDTLRLLVEGFVEPAEKYLVVAGGGGGDPGLGAE